MADDMVRFGSMTFERFEQRWAAQEYADKLSAEGTRAVVLLARDGGYVVMGLHPKKSTSNG